jgi:hypothetical protein
MQRFGIGKYSPGEKYIKEYRLCNFSKMIITLYKNGVVGESIVEDSKIIKDLCNLFTDATLQSRKEPRLYDIQMYLKLFSHDIFILEVSIFKDYDSNTFHIRNKFRDKVMGSFMTTGYDNDKIIESIYFMILDKEIEN